MVCSHQVDHVQLKLLSWILRVVNNSWRPLWLDICEGRFWEPNSRFLEIVSLLLARLYPLLTTCDIRITRLICVALSDCYTFVLMLKISSRAMNIAKYLTTIFLFRSLIFFILKFIIIIDTYGARKRLWCYLQPRNFFINYGEASLFTRVCIIIWVKRGNSYRNWYIFAFARSFIIWPLFWAVGPILLVRFQSHSDKSSRSMIS